jgi:glycosyltransferase involved in cell wall biosynthesis
MADLYASEFGARSTVIPYCVPPVTVDEPTGVLQRLGVTTDEFFVVGGRLNPENNIDRVAAAYTTTDLDHPLLVLGEANYDSPVATRLRELAERDERIRPVGHVGNRAEFFELLAGARAYLHGHSVGGMNPSLVEAMHVGAFIMALDTPFNRETAADGGTYFAVESLPDVLTDVARDDDERRKAQRSAAQERARRDYTLEEVAACYEALLRASIRTRKTGTHMATRWGDVGGTA